MKKSKFRHPTVIFFVSIVMAGLLAGALLFLHFTDDDLKAARSDMEKMAEYVQEQCVRYDNVAYENQVKSLVNVIDKTKQTGSDLQNVISKGLAFSQEELKNLAKQRRLSGIEICTIENDKIKETFRYTDDDLPADFWAQKIETFIESAVNNVKFYAERKLDDGYYYDYALYVDDSIDQNKIAVLCYIKQSVTLAEGTPLSLSTLLTDFNLTDSSIVISNGTNVIASNISELLQKRVDDCDVVKLAKYSSPDKYGLIKVKSDGETYYCVKGTVKNYFVYVYETQSEIFKNRSLKTSYLLVLFVFYLCAVSASYIIVKRLRQKQIEKKDAEYRKNLDKLALEAIRANEAKNDFLRRMSHDLRTPINGIQGIVRIGDYYADDLKKQAECRKKVLEAAGYLNEIVSDVLELSKLGENYKTWKNEPFSMKKLMNEIVSMSTNLAREHGVTLKSDLTQIYHDSLFGGAVPLKRIFINIISNAIKFSKENGEINFTAKETDYKEGFACFVFLCKDNGIGMSKEFQKRMYEPFTQENSDDSSQNGMGLGLAIVNKLVKALNGQIQVRSEPDIGTEFEITLSFAESEKIPEPVKTDEPGLALKGYTVLSVEDNALNAEINQFILETAGAKVISASNGKEAIEKFALSNVGEINAILMDIIMPETDGLTATRKIRSMDRADASTIPIIALTANAFSDDTERAFAAGMNEHVAKPVDSKVLIEKLKKLISENENGRKKIL